MSFIFIISRHFLHGTDVLLFQRRRDAARIFAYQVNMKWYGILKIGRIFYLDENFIKSNGIPAIIYT